MVSRENGNWKKICRQKSIPFCSPYVIICMRGIKLGKTADNCDRKKVICCTVDQNRHGKDIPCPPTRGLK